MLMMKIPHNIIKAARNGNAVKRWHTRRMLTSDSVGEHTANVLAIIFALDSHPSRNLLQAALYHDIAEQWTGDVPATAKWRSGRLKQACDALEEEMMLENSIQVPRLETEEWLTLKWADMLELLYRCFDEIELGNSTMHKVFNTGVEYLGKLDEHPRGVLLLNQLLQDYKHV